MKKQRIGVIYGGRSGEHEVSIASGAAVIGHLDPARYEPIPIRIDRDGRWTIPDRPPTSTSAGEVITHARRETGRSARLGREVMLVPHPADEAIIAIERSEAGEETARITGLGLDVGLSGAPRPLRRGWHPAGAARTGRRALRGRRRARLGGRDGQGGDEDAARSPRPPGDRCGRRRRPRVARGPARHHRAGRRPARLPGVRQAGQPRIERRHHQGEAGGRPRAGRRRGARVRPQGR